MWTWSFSLLKYILGQLGLCLPKNIYLFFILIIPDPIMVFLLSNYIKRALKLSVSSQGCYLTKGSNSQTSPITAKVDEMNGPLFHLRN